MSEKTRRTALALVIGTMAYNSVEAVIAIYSAAEARSIALLGFGLDSIIELAAASFLLWRLWVEFRGATPERVEAVERTVLRVVGTTFLLLSLYVIGQAGYMLVRHQVPSESLLGIILAGASLLIMPLIAVGKLRAARELQSAALRAEAKETLACAYLSFALLLGLGANAWLGWGWADPVASLLMVPWLIKEGIEGLKGEACGCDH